MFIVWFLLGMVLLPAAVIWAGSDLSQRIRRETIRQEFVTTLRSLRKGARVCFTLNGDRAIRGKYEGFMDRDDIVWVTRDDCLFSESVSIDDIITIAIVH